MPFWIPCFKNAEEWGLIAQWIRLSFINDIKKSLIDKKNSYNGKHFLLTFRFQVQAALVCLLQTHSPECDTNLNYNVAKRTRAEKDWDVGCCDF